MMCGGFGGDNEASPEAQEVLNAVKEELEQKLSLSHPINVLEVVKYKTQVVAGVNYLVKAKINNDKVVHVKIAKPLPHTGKAPFILSLVSEGLTHDSSLDII